MSTWIPAFAGMTGQIPIAWEALRTLSYGSSAKVTVTTAFTVFSMVSVEYMP